MKQQGAVCVRAFVMEIDPHASWERERLRAYDELTISADDVVAPISAALLLIAVLFGSSLFSSSVLTGIAGSIVVRTAGASQLEDRHAAPVDAATQMIRHEARGIRWNKDCRMTFWSRIRNRGVPK